MTQFPKLVGAFCATLFCAGTMAVLAEDNAAQAAARAELLREFQQAPAAQTTDASAPAADQSPAAAAPAVTAPATPPAAQPAPAEASPASASGDNPAQAAARALLLQELTATPASSNPAETATAAAPAASMVAAAPAVGACCQAQADAKAKAAADAKAAREAKALAKAKAAADAKAAREARAEAARKKASAAPAGVTALQPSSAVVGGRPISVPTPPINADQAARLQALDAKYTANQISPVDYFNQREAILSGQ